MNVFVKAKGLGEQVAGWKHRCARVLQSAPPMTLGIALVVPVLLASNSALAQSSVTLYGDVDDAIQYTSNQGGHGAVQMTNAGQYSSLWGLTGAEDIGGGTQILFKIEAGFNPNTGKSTGATNQLFNRQTYVGVSGSYGKLLVGEQYDATCDMFGRVSASQKFDGGIGSQIGDLNNLFCDFNLSNAIKYFSPTVAGFKTELMYRVGGVAGDFTSGSAVNAAVSYTNGPLYLVADYERVDDPATTWWGASASPVSGETWTNPLASPIFSGYASAAHYQMSGGGANLAFGENTIGLVYTNTLLQDVVKTSSTPFSGTAVFNDVQANYTIDPTPAWRVGIAANHTWAPDARYEQLMLGTQYKLSKRTLLYITSAYQHAHGVNSLREAAVAVNSNITASSSPNQLTVRVGIHHNF